MLQLTSSFLGSRFSKLQITAEPRGNPNAQRQVTCMAKKKGIRCIVTLECTEARAEGGTPSRYVTQKVRAVHAVTLCIDQVSVPDVHNILPEVIGINIDKNRKNTSGRLELKKYNKYLRRYTLHREIK